MIQAAEADLTRKPVDPSPPPGWCCSARSGHAAGGHQAGRAGLARIMQVALRSGIAAATGAAWARWRGQRLDLLGPALRPGLLAGALFAAEVLVDGGGLDAPPRALAVVLYTSPGFTALEPPLHHPRRASLAGAKDKYDLDAPSDRRRRGPRRRAGCPGRSLLRSPLRLRAGAACRSPSREAAVRARDARPVGDAGNPVPDRVRQGHRLQGRSDLRERVVPGPALAMTPSAGAAPPC